MPGEHPVQDPMWTAVDGYWAASVLAPDPVQEATLAGNTAGGLEAIDVSPLMGKLLHLLARSIGAGRILEIGTLGGYSTIWLARALPPGGALVTCELDSRVAEVARANIARAGLDDVVDVRVGPALHTLASLTGPFDLTFVDADKVSTAEYMDEAIRLTRPGGVIIVDNVVQGGRLVDPSCTDKDVVGIHRLARALRDDRRVDTTAIQTVGAKSYDGFLYALVKS